MMLRFKNFDDWPIGFIVILRHKWFLDKMCEIEAILLLGIRLRSDIMDRHK